ncbi:MAG TPA: VIT and VWA domain-containing protein [Planctomycetota bacterium]|nr:VIT and VWA domain-containing protein [Planctomycetota bacterium]
MRTTDHLPILLCAATTLGAQSPLEHSYQWVVPSRAVLAPPGCQAVRVVSAAAKVSIHDRAATTTLQIELHNPSATRQEAVLLLPVPDDAAVSSFAFEGAAAEPTARILPRDEARRLYDQITARLRDPALLEFVGWRCLRSSVFPVPPGGRQILRVTYDHVLDVDGERVDYVLPRSEALGSDAPWTITVDLQARAAIGVCYSPSHEIVIQRRSAKDLFVRVADGSRTEPGAFRLCYTTAADPQKPTAALFAYPDPTVGGGYFLLLASAPRPDRSAVLRREVTLVLDRSGSMAGRKLEQAKAAALQILEGLGDGEGIQLIDYGNDVATAFEIPVVKDANTLAKARAFLDNVRPHGGTNLHDALLEALRAPVLPGTLPLVLFLTDGLPTVGPTREEDLRKLVATGNVHGRRVFCFGVGNDVNVPLLDRIAEATRAVTTYVLPEEDVEEKVARTFARLDHPVLGEPVLSTVDAEGAAVARTAEMLPARLPDLFVGDQLVVLGQYRGDDDLRFDLKGKTPAGDKRYSFVLSVRGATTRHAFVPRLWASRQIAFLVDELRQQGGDLGAPLGARAVDPFANPRLRELRDEILRLSTRFGVLGEYTSFLATEGSDLGNWSALTSACQTELNGRAVNTRSGAGAVNQGVNLWAQKGQQYANYKNGYLDENMNRVETTAIQQICDRAFYRRGERWIDGISVVNKRLEPDECVVFGSARFEALRQQLEAEGRGGVLSLRGELLLEVDGKNVLITAPAAPAPGEQTQAAKETIR